MYKRWRVYSTFLTGFCIGLGYALLISYPTSPIAAPLGLIEWPVLVLTFSGILGGVIYSIVVDGHIEMPSYVANQGALFKAGLFGDILLGIAGAFLLESLLPIEISGAISGGNVEPINETAIAATGIIGGYGGRAIIKFSLERLFKVTGDLDQVRIESLERRRSQLEESQFKRSQPSDISVGADSPAAPEVNPDTDAVSEATISDRTLLLIDQLDAYIQAGLSEADWMLLVRQLRDAPTAAMPQILAALVDLQRIDFRQAGGAIGLTGAQQQRMIFIFEELIRLDPDSHQAYHQMALLYDAMSPPNYEQALSALAQAIARRGALALGQPWQYELDRAVVNIHADIQENLQRAQPSGRESAFNSALDSTLDLVAPRQANILADLLTISKVYNLETILKAAEAQQIPLPIVSWLQRYQLQLETYEDTRSLMAALRPILSDIASVAKLPPSSSLPDASSGSADAPIKDSADRVPERVIPDNPPDSSPSNPPDNPPSNPQGILFPQIYSSLGKCYDLLHLDPFDLMGSAKATQVFNFYPGEAIAAQDEGNTLWLPKDTQFIPGSKGSLQDSVQTSLLYTESDIQKLFTGTLGGAFGGTITRLIGAVLPFSFSASYSTFKQERKSERSVSAFTKAEYVHYAMALDWAAAASLHLNEAFQRAVAQLPLTAESYAYLNFIDSFGTHVSTHVKFGGLVHHRLRIDQSTYAAAVQRGANITFEAQKVFQAKHANSSQGSTYREISDSSQTLDFCGGIAKENIHDWFDTIKGDPAPIHLDLLPLCDVLTTTFFPQDSQIAQKRSLLTTAIQTYLERNSEPLAWELWPSVTIGGDGGSIFSDMDLAPNMQESNQSHYQRAQVQEVRVWIKNWIERVQLVLTTDLNSEQETEVLPLSAHGSEDGNLKILRLDPGDYIEAVKVSAASPQKIVVERGTYVGALELHTHQGRVWTVGTPGNNAIALDIPDNYQVIGFHGRVGKYIDKIGVISMPVLSNELERKSS